MPEDDPEPQPSEYMSDELIKSLNQRISELERAKTNLEVAVREARREAKAAKTERDEAVAQADEIAKGFEELEGEHKGLQEQLKAAPDALQKQIADLQGEIRTRDHRKVFDAQAKEAGVNEKALDDLWSLSGYKAEGEAADPAKITDLLTKAKSARPYLFESPTPEGDGNSLNGKTTNGQTVSRSDAPLTEGLANGRGARDQPSARFKVRHSDVGNPAWMREHQSKLNDAVANGTVEYVAD